MEYKQQQLVFQQQEYLDEVQSIFYQLFLFYKNLIFVNWSGKVIPYSNHTTVKKFDEFDIGPSLRLIYAYELSNKTCITKSNMYLIILKLMKIN